MADRFVDEATTLRASKEYEAVCCFVTALAAEREARREAARKA